MWRSQDFQQSWCDDFARNLLALRPSMSTREAQPIARRFYDSSYNFDPDEAVRMALNSNLIRRSDSRTATWDGDTAPGIFDRRVAP